jgi:hypothetical protein
LRKKCEERRATIRAQQVGNRPCIVKLVCHGPTIGPSPYAPSQFPGCAGSRSYMILSINSY